MISYILNTIKYNLSIKNILIIFVVLTLLTLNSLLSTGDIFSYYSYFFNYPTIIFITHGNLYMVLISQYTLSSIKINVFEKIRIKFKVPYNFLKILTYQIFIFIYILFMLTFSSIGHLFINQVKNLDIHSHLKISPEFSNIYILILILVLVVYLYLNLLSIISVILFKYNVKDIYVLSIPLTLNIILMGISALPSFISDLLYKIIFIRLYDSNLGIIPIKSNLTTLTIYWSFILVPLLIIAIKDTKTNNYYHLLSSRLIKLLFINIIVDISNYFSSLSWNNFNYLNNKFYIIDHFNLISYAQHYFLIVVYYVFFIDLLNILKKKYGIFIYSRTNKKYYKFIIKTFITFTLCFLFLNIISTFVIHLILKKSMLLNIKLLNYIFSILLLTAIWILIDDLKINSVTKSIISMILIVVIDLSFQKINILINILILIISYICLTIYEKFNSEKRRNIYVM